MPAADRRRRGRARPWGLKVMVHGLLCREPIAHYVTAEQGMRAADRQWRGGLVLLVNGRDRWVRLRGQWTHETAPAKPGPELPSGRADQPLADGRDNRQSERTAGAGNDAGGFSRQREG